MPAIVPSRETLKSAHLGLAEDLLGRHGREHPDERLLDVLRQLVDHAVRADVDALALRKLLASALGLTLKPTTSACEADARLTSFS